MNLESVTCCGAGDNPRGREPDYYLHLNARILAYAEAADCDTLLTVCNVCTLNLRQANWQLKNDKELRTRVADNLRRVGVPPYSGNVEVRHLLWEIAEGEGFELLKQSAHKGLKGLKVRRSTAARSCAPRRSSGSRTRTGPVARADHRGVRRRGDRLPAKIKCCGFPIIQAREETALGELIQPIEQATEAGADAMVTPCPLCHLSLDGLAVEAVRGDGQAVPNAHPPPLAARGRGGRPRGVGAQVQAPRRARPARSREARGLNPRFRARKRPARCLTLSEGRFPARRSP